MAAIKTIRAVASQIGSARSGCIVQFLSLAPVHPLLIYHKVCVRLVDSHISIDGALLKRGILSDCQLEKVGT